MIEGTPEGVGNPRLNAARRIASRGKNILTTEAIRRRRAREGHCRSRHGRHGRLA